MHNRLTRLAPALALTLPLLAMAQQSASPSDPKASTPALRYRSAFADYQSWQDVKPADWKQVNDAVAPAPGPANGAAGHGSAAAASAPAAPKPAPAASGPASPAAPSQRPGHHGHAMPGGRR